MRLTDLNPRWCSFGENRDKMGVTFDCPHCAANPAAREPFVISRLAIFFDVPIDGGPAWAGQAHKVETHGLPDHHVGEILWHREGDTFETLTLTPSVDASKFGHWHGFIRNGAIT